VRVMRGRGEQRGELNRSARQYRSIEEIVRHTSVPKVLPVPSRKSSKLREGPCFESGSIRLYLLD